MIFDFRICASFSSISSYGPVRVTSSVGFSGPFLFSGFRCSGAYGLRWFFGFCDRFVWCRSRGEAAGDEKM